MDTSHYRKPVIIITLVTITITIIIGIFFAMFNRTAPERAIIEDYDPISGETIYDFENREPELGTSSDSPVDTRITLGKMNLINKGVTSDQMDSIDREIRNFIDQQKKTVKLISIDKSIYGQAQNSEGDWMVTFDFVLDKKDRYNAEMIKTGISSIKLVIKQSGKTLYQSS